MNDLTRPSLEPQEPIPPLSDDSINGVMASIIDDEATPIALTAFEGAALADLALAVRESTAERIRLPAGFGVRAGAMVMDCVILCVLIIIALALAWLLVNSLAGATEGELQVLMPGIVVGLALLYWSSEIFFATTPGKSFLDLRVTGPDGYPASPQRRVARWAVRNLPFVIAQATWVLIMLSLEMGMDPAALFPAVWMNATVATVEFAALFLSALLMAGSLMVFLPRHRALHDLLSGTAVFSGLNTIDRSRQRGFRVLSLPSARPSVLLDAGPSTESGQ